MSPTEMLLVGVSTVFESLGRELLCLDPDLRIVHVSEGLDPELAGRPVKDVLGPELFGEQGPLRRALLAGERREGWSATLDTGHGTPRRLSLSVAPIRHHPSGVCDPRVAYVVMLRPAEEGDGDAAGEPTAFSGIVARSAAMLRIFRLIENLQESDATLLLTGESGTGKERVARAVHLHSPRRNGPFVAVNCGALPGDLLESELFGHVRGAFTGAVQDRVGRFELARGGTLFLDEIGDLPLQLQVKLLRVLQERTFERVGESRSRHADARIIAATNADLRRATAGGTFREDLYYRLRVVPIEIPPLRERRADVEPLAHHLLARICERHGRSLILSPDALRRFLLYRWPGNVRELENALEYAVAVCRGQTIHAEDLPAELLEPQPAPLAWTLPLTADESPSPEQDELRAALEAHRWRREETARALGMSRTTLWRRMRELGLTEHGVSACNAPLQRNVAGICPTC
ncbi:MAG: sigma-54 interaction domain-containing protein [Thermoanaerobaculia bacterium]